MLSPVDMWKEITAAAEAEAQASAPLTKEELEKLLEGAVFIFQRGPRITTHDIHKMKDLFGAVDYPTNLPEFIGQVTKVLAGDNNPGFNKAVRAFLEG